MGIGRQQATVDRNFGMLFSGEDIPSDYGPYLEAFGKLPVVQGLIQCLDSNGFGKTTLGIQNP
jgi:hypothetical protein